MAENYYGEKQTVRQMSLALISEAEPALCN